VGRKTGEDIEKAECFLQYNDKMGGVDRNDQLAKYYSFARKVMKVWKKDFFFVLHTVVLQGYPVYLKCTKGNILRVRSGIRQSLINAKSDRATYESNSGKRTSNVWQHFVRVINSIPPLNKFSDLFVHRFHHVQTFRSEHFSISVNLLSLLY